MIRLGTSQYLRPLNVQLCAVANRRYQCLTLSKQGRAKGKTLSVIIHTAKSTPNFVYIRVAILRRVLSEGSKVQSSSLQRQ